MASLHAGPSLGLKDDLIEATLSLRESQRGGNRPRVWTRAPNPGCGYHHFSACSPPNVPHGGDRWRMVYGEGSTQHTDGGTERTAEAMSTSMLVSERPIEREGAQDHPDMRPPAGPESRPAASGLRRAMPIVAMVTGLAVMAVAGLLVTAVDRSDRSVTDPAAITLSARDVSVVTQVYAPGEDSGWHSHPGIHAVAVVSGVLTVVDSQCQIQTFEPGRPYVGGQDPHLVANRTDAPVIMAVTYLSPSVPNGSTQHHPAPAGCG